MPRSAYSGFAPCCPDGCLSEYQDPSDIAVRFGWWAAQLRGSPWVVGQWQDTHSSPFWDIDGLFTNGVRTFNYSATGTDNESTKANLQYYGPNSQGSISFNRFIHAQEHESLDNMKAASFLNSQRIVGDESVLNVGQDYAIRVDQFESKFQTNLTDRIKFGVNIWDQREFGDRQANAATHCFTVSTNTNGTGPACHTVSQRQSIDWNTFQVTPSLEFRGDRVNLQYSHTLRVFSADDQAISMDYDAHGGWLQGIQPVDVVPSSLFNQDKIKLGIDLTDHTKFYGFGYIGWVENNDVGVQREFGGVDLRLTNTSIKGLSVTAYAKNYNQSGETPITALSSIVFPTGTNVQGLIPNPIGFNRYTAGIKGSYRPWAGRCADSCLTGLSFTGGYEYEYLIRVNENWQEANTSTAPILYQPNTTMHTLSAGVQTPFSSDLHAYARYKLQFIAGTWSALRRRTATSTAACLTSGTLLNWDANGSPALVLALHSTRKST